MSKWGCGSWLLAGLLSTAFTVPCGASGYEFEGVGAEAVSRGGAMIADSDDWTAMYWNPGNIARATANRKKQVGLEIFGGEAFGKDSNSLSAIPNTGPFSKNELSSHFILGAIGGNIPVGEKGGFGFGFYTPLLQGADFEDTSPSTGQRLKSKGHAGILTWNVSGSYAILPNLSVGAGVNLLYGKLEQDTEIAPYLALGNITTSHTEGDGYGLEGTFGVRYDPHPKFSLGAVYRTGSDVEIEGDSTINNTLVPVNEASRFRFELRQPPTAGVGLAVRPTEKMAFSFDINRTFWNRFSNATDYETDGTMLVDRANTFDWSNTWKLRLGSKIALTKKTDWLAGYAYDEPALDAGSVDLSTAVDVYMSRFSTGFAHAWNEKWKSVVGILAGYGERHENGIHYQLSGWQAMLESSVTF